ncbi:MAG: ral stress protein [Flavipsychrobacter sp.]|jgi:general stress protein 26|nr:ral stress protein [Flavipsychrobacter sp.]
MGNTKNLEQKEAIEKMKKMAKDVDICMFCTELAKTPFEVRPMSTQDVDNEGNFWFLSDKGSDKDREIKQDDKVQLLYADRNNSEYMTVFGHADVFYDRQKVEELWKPHAKAWFTEGKDDPDISIIRLRPEQGYYWDTKHGGMVAFFKMMVSAAVGKTMDDSIEGTMKP